MNMTVNQLHKALGKLLEKGHGRKPVCIDKTSFKHNCEDDGVVILPVCGIEIGSVLQMADDGGIKENKDGSESFRVNLVLYGESGWPKIRERSDDEGSV